MKIDYPLILDQLKFKHFDLNFYRLEDIDLAVEQLCQMAELYPEKFDYPPEDLCPYYGVLWDSALALIEYIKKYELPNHLPILEIGCGLALPSLYLAKKNYQHITAMDFHPNVEELFHKNLQLNQVQINYQQCDWTKVIQPIGDFPILIGSDILYEGRHPQDLAQAILKLSTNLEEVIIADPKRGREKIFYQILIDHGFKQELHEITINHKDILVIHFKLGKKKF